MTQYILRRIIYSIPLLLVISLISFIVIVLPPGDYLSTLQGRLQNRAGFSRTEALKMVNQIREKYGLDNPFYLQYFTWVKNIIIHGDLGYSFDYKKPVSNVIWNRLGWTLVIALSSHFISVVIGVIFGIFSATHQYSIGDNILTFISFLGVSIPAFFFALVIMFYLAFYQGMHVGGLFSPRYVMEPWSWARFVDLLKHLWIPLLVVGFAGTARNLRVMRGNLLDVLQQQYVQTARAKGLNEQIVIYKHAVRNAIQPIIMYLGMALPFIIQGSIVTSIVLNLPTTGPVYYRALMRQDMYLAGSFLMMLAVTLVIGNILGDILLAWSDPRIRYE